MDQVGQRQQAGVSGRFFREFRGDKYWLWPKRGIYVSQKGGKQRLLHREAFNGGGGEVVPVDGDWENFDPANWRSRNKCSERAVPSVHPYQEFGGVKYYRQPEDGYYSRRFPRIEYMHRAIWAHHHGPIDPGFHVHHVNGDKGDNRIENLELLSASEHTAMHSKDSRWVGSDANREQLRQSSQKAAEWHGSKIGLDWHREHGKNTWAKRSKYSKVCEHCGTSYETYWPNKSRFCSRNCGQNARYHARNSL